MKIKVRKIILLLGSDNDLIADWENGIFKDNFRGVWGAIDGYLAYMEISYEGDGMFLQMFEMRDMQGYSAYSDAVIFEVINGVITTSVGY